ncbi:recombinase family protein [Bariatricus massiliensis]|uniref:Recombinase family protein n=1 Tax=Bariatricus massiliensis TaxID=1745713 RepID=A0ABS8DBH6_9FIRM|nr:recombinase family protein [Bariatricus massiliensis]MCB7303681.1 recombinase family protein [Bariatricus massiliensis]MCB7373097.1 recombinase family protein [Bariatricus massiliensis]MCB7385767.1 recombinase family protein [Bariatricus massiliensis]MCB7409929.1 recombinase family protein [Bariatricus massiliensis]MCQ5253102.1 recombinase family protein [Bariatricus massiliensis]
MNISRMDVIYARQSVDRKDSISIESQIDFCKYELRGGSHKVFKDKGYSGKNTDRPEFQKLLVEIKKGTVKRVVVYKLDRISRSILDFANMMELFQQYDVEFVSSTEKFDTSTPMGRAMLNICIVFAQLERETIQKRVTDAYYSRCTKGFHMSGQAPYGYRLEPTVVEGIRTKMMVAEPEAAEQIRLMFEMYAEPETSFGDITRYFEEQNIRVYDKSLARGYLSQLLRNPVYAQADLELYEFFKSQGAAIINDPADFAGTNGCYLYQGRDVKEDKDKSLKDQILVIAPHEPIVSSDVWLRCRKKLMNNTAFQGGRKAQNTWLAGKVKCGNCGYALKVTHNPAGYEYLRCNKRADNGGCKGCGTIRKNEFEQFVFTAMCEKLREFKLLRGGEEKVNPKLTALQVELAQVENEIEKLLDTLTGANATLLAYANSKIEALDTNRQALTKQIAELSVETVSPKQIELLSGYLDDWENVCFDDKRKVVDGLISQIRATNDYVQIEWKI